MSSSKEKEPTHPPYVTDGQVLDDFLRSFWQRQIDSAEQEAMPDYRHPPLPLARIKKVMKNDPDVKMIAADAPILFCKACEIFISEITARAFIIASSHKRRTVSRADIAAALGKSDTFDFLLDIVPKGDAAASATGKSSTARRGSKAAQAQAAATTLKSETLTQGEASGSGSHGDFEDDDESGDPSEEMQALPDSNELD